MNVHIEAQDSSVELAHTRAELQKLLDPEFDEPDTRTAAPNGRFPRSLTMKVLAGNRGAGPLLMLAVGALAFKPALAMRVLRYVPVNAIARALVARYIGSKGAKS